MDAHKGGYDEEQEALSGDAHMHEAARHQVHSVVNLVELHQSDQLDPLDDFAQTA